MHGTYLEALKGETGALQKGLSRMKRNHVHLASGLLGEDGVISGMRHDCSVYIWVDVHRAIQSGLTFYESDNGVILTSGDSEGFVSSALFSVVIELHDGLDAKHRAKTARLKLIERLFPGCSRVVAKKLHGGFSDSLVLRTDSYGADGHRREPTVTKIDTGKATRLEVKRTR